jgi:hypothetical protein
MIVHEYIDRDSRVLRWIARRVANVAAALMSLAFWLRCKETAWLSCYVRKHRRRINVQAGRAGNVLVYRWAPRPR